MVLGRLDLVHLVAFEALLSDSSLVFAFRVNHHRIPMMTTKVALVPTLSYPDMLPVMF